MNYQRAQMIIITSSGALLLFLIPFSRLWLQLLIDCYIATDECLVLKSSVSLFRRLVVVRDV